MRNRRVAIIVVLGLIVTMPILLLVPGPVQVRIEHKMTLAGPDEPIYYMVLDPRTPLEDIKKALLENPGVVNTFSMNRSSLLSLAVETNRIDVMQLLLDHGADIHGRTASVPEGYQNTPLYSAIVYKKYEAAQFLLEAGADPLLQDSSGFTEIDYAKDDERMLALLESYAPDKPRGANSSSEEEEDHPKEFRPKWLSP
jgi:ankyrin repeat protein